MIGLINAKTSFEQYKLFLHFMMLLEESQL